MNYQLAVVYDWTAANKLASEGYELISVLQDNHFRFCYFFQRAEAGITSKEQGK